MGVLKIGAEEAQVNQAGTALERDLHRAVHCRHLGGIDLVNHHADGVGACAEFQLAPDVQAGAQDVSERCIAQAQFNVSTASSISCRARSSGWRASLRAKYPLRACRLKPCGFTSSTFSL